MFGLVTLILVFSLSLTESLTQNGGNGGLEECTSIAEDTGRLACFDAYAARVKAQNAGSLKAEKSSIEQVVEAKEEHRQIEEQRQEDFGLTDVAIARREAQKEAQKQAQETQSRDPESKPEKPRKLVPENLVAHVKEFARNNRTKRIRITLDNGQVWQEIDANPFRGTVKPGTEVTIVKRPFGGYKMEIPERRAVIYVRRIK